MAQDNGGTSESCSSGRVTADEPIDLARERRVAEHIASIRAKIDSDPDLRKRTIASLGGTLGESSGED